MGVMARLCKRARARLGGARRWNIFLLKCNAIVCWANWLTLTPFLSYSPLFFKIPSLFFSLFFLFSSFFHSLFFFSFFISFFWRIGLIPTLVWMDLIAGWLPISPTLGLCHMTLNQVCGVGVSFRVCSIADVPKCWCTSHVPGYCMSPVLLNLNLQRLGPRIPEGAY